MKFSAINIVICFVVMLVVILIVSIPTSNLSSVDIIEKKPLISIINVKNMEGSFFLASGSISEEPYYFYYEGEDSFVLKKYSAYNAKIFYTNDTPYVEYKIAKTKVLFFISASEVKMVSFHIPEGSIVQNYNLDLRDLR